jgi:hypothetical protein
MPLSGKTAITFTEQFQGFSQVVLLSTDTDRRKVKTMWGARSVRQRFSRKERIMGKQLEREVEYYYDTHPTKEDLMGETAIHAYLVRYLVLVLQWLFHEQVCAIYDNLNFYQTRNPKEYPLAPDIAVIKGIPFQ